MPLSLCTKVTQQTQHFCLKNVACNDTLYMRFYINFKFYELQFCFLVLLLEQVNQNISAAEERVGIEQFLILHLGARSALEEL